MSMSQQFQHAAQWARKTIYHSLLLIRHIASLKPSSAISTYVNVTLDIKAAGITVRSEPKKYLPFLSRYAVTTHRAIIASVWLLQEKYRQMI